MALNDHRKLLESNQPWVAERLGERPDCFTCFGEQQTPEYVWIGCSDSRVPAETITGCQPGELFVHRNIASQVIHTDLNLLTVLYDAVQELEVKHIIVWGHHGCGGVQAALSRRDFGLINRWLQGIKDLAERHEAEQVDHLAKASVVQRAWKKEGRPWLHGWVYDMETGLLEEVVRRTSADLPADIHRYDLPED